MDQIQRPPRGTEATANRKWNPNQESADQEGRESQAEPAVVMAGPIAMKDDARKPRLRFSCTAREDLQPEHAFFAKAASRHDGDI